MSDDQHTPAAEASPPLLNARHQQILEERAIPIEIALAAGLNSVDLGRLKDLRQHYKLPKKWPGLPLPTGATGILIPYPWRSDGVERARVRLDETEITLPSSIEGARGHDEKTVLFPRYLAQADVKVGPYIPRCVQVAAADPSIPIAFVEAPLKALALCAHYVPAIGLGGVLAGCHDTDILADTEAIVAHPDLCSIVWTGRTTFIVFDAGMWSSRIGDGNPMVALGAAYVWRAVSKLGADVRAVQIPYMHPKEWAPEDEGLPPGPEDQGPDDYLFRHGADALRLRIEEALPADPKLRLLTAMAGNKGAEATAAVAELLSELFFVATLYVLEPHELKALAAISAKAGIKYRELAAAVTGFRDKLAAKSKEAKAGTVYEIRDGAFHVGDNKLSNFTAEIIEDVHRDDGLTRTRIYRIQGRLEDGTFLQTVDIPADEFASMKWLDASWGARPNMAAGRSVPDHVRAAIKEHSKPTARTIYAVTGWHEIDGKKVFLMPTGIVGLDKASHVEVDPPGMADYGFPALPGQEDLRDAVRHSLSILDVAPDIITMPVLGTNYLAPLATDLGINFAAFLVGRTGTFKSAVAGLAMAHYGARFDYDNLPGTWYSTATFLEAQLHRAKDVLLAVDNYVPPQSTHEMRDLRAKALRVLQTIGDRQARGRCNTDATEKPQKRPRTMAICTGEILPPTNESTLGRIVVVEVEKGGVSLDEVRRVRRDVGKLGQAMHGYVQFLAAHNYDIQMLAAFNREHVLGPALEGAHERTPTSLAMLLTGFEKFMEFARSVGALTESEALALVSRCIAALVKVGQTQPRTESPMACDEYIAAVRSMLISGRATLSSPASGTLSTDLREIGWDAGEEVLLEPDATLAAVVDLKRASWQYGPTEVHQQLRAALHDDGLPVLAAVGDGRNVPKKRTIGDRRPRVLVFRRAVFEDALASRTLWPGLQSVLSSDDHFNLLDTV